MKEKEIAHYDNEKLWEKLSLSDSNKERIERTVGMIPEEVDSIADIGCGSGLFLNHIEGNLGISSLMGVDFSQAAMKTLRTNKKIGDISQIPLEDNSYDLVSVLEVLEHLGEEVYDEAKKELARVSKKYILVSVPFSEDLRLETVKCPNCRSKFNKSHHKRTFEEDSIKNLFEGQGYEYKRVEYISKRNVYFLITPLLRIWKRIRGCRDLRDTVCPVCGYTEKDVVRGEEKKEAGGKISFIAFLKRIWPKKYTYKWIACLYVKIS
jgi:ubiquinone/menaquinone biosynthesis C-methylase UbiE